MAATHFFAASPESVGVDPRGVEALFARTAQEVSDGLLPSSQAAIARRGKIAAMRTVGTITHGGPPTAATNDTLYVVFSCTKAITSAAGWLLIQDNKLGIDERVADIIPEFATHGKDVITVEQLFTHTAGFPHAPMPPLDWHDPDKRRERFRNWRLNWEPGSRFEYHPTSSMWVIADIIERRSGIEYREFVRRRIAEPLGLPGLYVGLPESENRRVADIVHVGSLPTHEELRALGWPDIPENEVTEDALQGFNHAAVRAVGVPGGGGIMTAADLALFYQALLDGRAHDGRQIWKPETLAMARQVRTGDLLEPNFKVRVNRGLGIVIAGDEHRNYRGFGHTGSPVMFGHNGAGGQIAWADPESGLSFVYCTNGFDRHPMRQGRRGVAISSRAAVCALPN